MKSCEICSKTNQVMQVCSACKQAHYCSLNCQRVGWKSHKTECFKLNQIFMSNKAVETVVNNKVFNRMMQYIHHFNISDNKNLLLCLLTPNFNNLKQIESYSSIINVAPTNEFSEEIKTKLEEGKRSVFFLYYDDKNNQNSSKGSIINFDSLNYEKRDMLCYESIKLLELPTVLTVYLDGRCE